MVARRSCGAMPLGSAARARPLLAARWLSSAPAAEDLEWTVKLSEAAAERIHFVTPESPLLRLGVESGGCSGFSYKFEIEGVVPTDKDRRATGHIIRTH